MRIKKDGVYQPPYMIERPGGFHISRFCVRPERPVVAEDDPDAGDAALCRAALHKPVVSPAEERDDLMQKMLLFVKKLLTNLL